MERTSFRTVVRRRWWWLLVALAALYVAYVLAAAIFLNTSLGPSVINRQPERFQMQWASGRSWWPGRVTLIDVRLQGQARRVAWQAQAARVQGRIALRPLLDRRLQVP